MKGKYYSIIVIFLAVSIGFSVALNNIKKTDNPYVDFKTFAQVLNIIKARYVQPVDEKRLMEGAYRGAVESTFDQNSYIPESLMERLKNRQTEKGGLGFKVMKRSGYAMVIYSDKNSDVFKAGLEAGTILKKINGQNTYDMSLFEIKSMLKGVPGEKIKLKFYSVNNGEDVEQEFTYKEYSELTTYIDTLETLKIFAIHEFTDTTIEDFKKYAESVETPIIDLRYNQGKNYNSMLKTAAFLTGKKETAVFEEKNNTTTLEGLPFNKFDREVIVLTSGFTMNAGAVLAEILKGEKGITLIGTKTSGKAFESTLLKLKTGGFVEIATGFYSPLTEKGLKPDIRSYIDDDEIERAVNKFVKEKVANGEKKEAA
jgi:carboxyl-terminal processing protease